jgi:hypothetical protein
MEALAKAYGQQKAQQIMQSGGKAIRHTDSEILRLRPDIAGGTMTGSQ